MYIVLAKKNFNRSIKSQNLKIQVFYSEYFISISNFSCHFYILLLSADIWAWIKQA